VEIEAVGADAGGQVLAELVAEVETACTLTSPCKLIGGAVTISLDLKKENRAEDMPLVKMSAT
jgi:hypothetical protein